jgi:predicted O-methyltransferase YrrM
VNPIQTFLNGLSSIGEKAELEFRFAVKFALWGHHRDLPNMNHLEALAASVDSVMYAQEHMHGCPRFRNKFELLKAAAEQVTAEGIVAEFGVHSGRTVNYIAELLPDQKVFGFDSFEGLPEDWETVKKGTFAVSALPDVRPNVELVVGWFDATLPTFVSAHPSSISLLHVDCDLYSSTKTVFQFLNERVTAGTVVVFDEYFNYAGWRHHEHKAFGEFCQENGIEYEYIGFVPADRQVGVRITKRLT